MSRDLFDSGIKWVGSIPTDWKVIRNRYLFLKARTIVGELWNSTQLLSLTKNGIKTRSTDDNTGKIPESYDGYQLVKKNQMVMCLFDLDCSAVFSGISTLDGMISPAYTVLDCTEKILPMYADYWFRFVFDGRKYMDYAKNIRYALPFDDFKDVLTVVPPIEEQKEIVSYLDKQCAIVDKAIDTHRRIISKLEEYRTAEISRSVTKGIHTGVPTKDSGSECTGNIPSHWDYCKILYVLDMPITDGPHETPIAVDEGIPFISAEAVSQGNGSIDFEHMWGYVSQEFYEQCCKKYTPKRDDIYMIKSGATTGKVAIVDTDRIFTIWSPLAVLRVNPKIMAAKYLFYYVQSNSYQQQVELGWNYGTQQNIGMRMVERLKVCVPPLNEQNEIVSFIDKVWDKTNIAKEKEKGIIQKLEEYRKSIIYNAVTGKIDSRGGNNE